MSAFDAHTHRLLMQLADPTIRFPPRPALVPDLSIFDMPDGLGVQFRGAETPVVIRGRLAQQALSFLLPRLDGSSSVEDLLAACPDDLPKETLLKTLLLLHTKGLLVDATSPGAMAPGGQDDVLGRQLLFWGRHLDLTRSARSAAEVQRRISSVGLVLVGTGLFGVATYDLLTRSGATDVRVLAWNDDGLLHAALVDALQQPREIVHLQTTSVGDATRTLRGWSDTADLFITATIDAPNALFRALNRVALQRRVPWLRGAMSGSQLEIGPYVCPYESACFTCMELREASMQEGAIEEQLYQEHLAEERPAAERVLMGEALWVASLAASLLVGEAVRVVTGIAPPTLTDAVTRVSPIGGKMQTNRFRRVPRCPDCYRGEIRAHHIADPNAGVTR